MYFQGRRKLPKARWTSSNVGGHNLPPLVQIGLNDLPKLGWAIAHSSSTSLLFSDFIFFFRIWSHGLQSHQRKSALWHYLYKFGRTNEKLLRFKGTLGVQAYCIPLINSKPYILPDHSRPIQVVIDPKVRKNSFVRAHHMSSRFLNFLLVIGFFEKKIHVLWIKMIVIFLFYYLF